MVSGIATLLGALPGVFDTDDMRTAFLWLEKFVRNPWSHDDANTYGGKEPWPAAMQSLTPRVKPATHCVKPGP